MAEVQFFGVDENIVISLNEPIQKFLVDIDFHPITYEKAIKLGFGPENWEKINFNKVLVDGVHYKEINTIV